MPLFKPFGFYKPKVVAAVPAVDRILDTYPGAVAGYSLRLISKTYAGSAIEVRRSSDNATQNIGFDANGDLDESALITFVGANNGFVSKWYDQSGNGEHMEQSTAANQAQIVSSGTVIKQGTKPAIRFDGSNDAYTSAQSTNPFSYTSPISVVSTVYKNATAYKAYETIIGAGATGTASTNNEKMVGFGFGNSGTVSPKPAIVTDIWRPAGIQYNGTVSTDDRMVVGTYISNWSTHRSTGLSNLTLNGTDIGTATYGSFNPATPTNTNPMKLGVFDEILATSYFGGDMQEVLVWTTDENSNRSGIQTDVNDYWDIYVGNIVQTSLEQWLDADNAGGSPSSTWTDTQGNFDGTPTSVTYVSGTPSYYNFPNTSGNKVDCGTPPSFMQGSGNKAYTIQFWLYPTANSGNMGIVQFGNAGTTGGELTLKTRGNAVGQMRLEFGGSSARNMLTPYLTAGSWYMVTIVQDGSTNGDVNVFLDNTDEYGTLPALTTGMNIGSSGKFNIGLQEAEEWNGRFGQFILYSKALNQTEINQNYDYFKLRYGKS